MGALLLWPDELIAGPLCGAAAIESDHADLDFRDLPTNLPTGWPTE